MREHLSSILLGFSIGCWLVACNSGASAPDDAGSTLSGGSPASTPDSAATDALVGPVTYQVSGVAQKGPFANGATVTVAECDDSLAPTGRTFATSIVDNTGSFALPNVQLVGKYMSLGADGFYFDEVANQLSVSRIALSALADATNRKTVNVNLLTHLEKPRITYLIGQGLSFAQAKLQAQREVLGIFGFTLSDAAPSESLDISRGTDDDAVLLAVSAILQGRRTPAELTELLSNIATDLRTDGTLNSRSLGSALMNEAYVLNLAAVRDHLEKRYSLMGITATIGNFEKYVKAFVSSGKYSLTDTIAYPDSGTHGANILSPTITSYGIGQEMSLLATLPRGTSLKIRFFGQGEALWGYWLGRTSCWTVTTYDSVLQQQEFTAAGGDAAQSCDLDLSTMAMANPLMGADARPGDPCIKIEYYENFELFGVGTPTKTRTICQSGVSSQNDGGVAKPVDLDAGAVPDALVPEVSKDPSIGGAADNPCLGGQSLCSGVCTSVSSDMQNCGACGKACVSPQICSTGACTL